MVRVGTGVAHLAAHRLQKGMTMNDDNDLGRDIERSWLIRGEYDKVYEARGNAAAIFGGIVIVSIILCFLLNALGIW